MFLTIQEQSKHIFLVDSLKCIFVATYRNGEGSCMYLFGQLRTFLCILLLRDAPLITPFICTQFAPPMQDKRGAWV